MRRKRGQSPRSGMSFVDQRGVKSYDGVNGATIGNGGYHANLQVTGRVVREAHSPRQNRV